MIQIMTGLSCILILKFDYFIIWHLFCLNARKPMIPNNRINITIIATHMGVVHVLMSGGQSGQDKHILHRWSAGIFAGCVGCIGCFGSP